MKSKSLIVMFALFLASCTSAPTEDMQTYGEKPVLTEATMISAILESPEDFVGKKVLVKGKILDVCEKQGCWIDIAGDKPGQMIKVKVNDGEIVFPMSTKGKEAIAEGEVYKIEMNEEEAISYMEHVAEEKGATFDAASVSGPMTLYQVKGSGAMIEK